MSDNRFKDYPTKRIPSINKENGEEILREAFDSEDYDEYDDYDYEEYDDEFIDTEYDKKSAQQRREYERSDRPVYRYPRGAERAAHSSRQRRTNQNRQNYGERTPRGGAQSKRKTAKTAFVAAYIGLLVVAVAICITVLVLVFQWIVREAPTPNGFLPTPPPAAENNEPEPPPTGPVGRPDIRNISTMITGINSDPRALVLLDLETLQTTELPLPEEALISDTRGNDITFSQLRVGQIIDVGYDARAMEIATIRENPRAWVREERTNVHVNIENQTISVGHEAFEFNSQTLVLHRGERINISEIRVADSVTVKGLGSTAWLVQLDASSGSLLLTNAGEIVNGRITIGNLHPLFLGEITEPIDVVEGPHRIVVEGDNIETFVENIVISAGQTLDFDLSAVEFTLATLNIITTPENAIIFVNDERAVSPVQVEFGEHTIRVESDGYVTEERTVNVVLTSQDIQIDMEAVILDAVLTITTSPSNAEIIINNERIGRADFGVTVELPPGSYNIRVRLEGHVEQFITIVLTPGQIYARHITLTPIAIIDDRPVSGSDDDEPDSSGHIPIPPPPMPTPRP